MTHDPTLEPWSRFEAWYREAQAAPAIRFAHAATLATVDSDGSPDARMVLVHRFGPEGLWLASREALEAAWDTVEERFREVEPVPRPPWWNGFGREPVVSRNLAYNPVERSMMQTIPLSDAETRLGELLTDVENLGEHVMITRSGRPAGVLLPVDEYEGLLETLDVLADAELLRAVHQGLEEITRGDVVSHEALWNELDTPIRG